MDAQKIQFMVSIQLEIDKLDRKLGSTHIDVITTKNLFHKLSQIELSKNKIEKIIPESEMNLIPIKSDTEAIRSHLEIRANVSISYDFIFEDRVRKQLIADNKRMENVLLNLKLNEQERFYNYCVAAFLQIEELVNYYFGLKYSPEDFFKLISEKNLGKQYNQKKISEVPISEKIYLFENLFYRNQVDTNAPFVYYESIINLIKDVRNEELHRCNIIEQNNIQIMNDYNELLMRIRDFNKSRVTKNIYYQKSQEEKQIEKQGKLLKFINEKNYNLIRDTISELSYTIKKDLEK